GARGGPMIHAVVAAIQDFLGTFDTVVLAYFVVVNTAYLGLVALAAIEVVKHRRWQPVAGADDAYRSPLTDPVTILMPAYNEGGGIVSAVQAVGALRYPTYEVVVIDDG